MQQQAAKYPRYLPGITLMTLVPNSNLSNLRIWVRILMLKMLHSEKIPYRDIPYGTSSFIFHYVFVCCLNVNLALF
jgi:hypothetical protein